MATLKQIEANRRNAQQSTGPRTPEGKAAVSLNALRHGLRARTVVLPAESRQDFHRLCDDLAAEWQPLTRTEHFYLEQMAVAQWKLMRMEVGEADLFHGDAAAQTQVPLLDRLWQAQCRLERSFARAHRELERLQNSRRHPIHPPEEPAPAPRPAAEFPPPASAPTAPDPQPARNDSTFVCLAAPPAESSEPAAFPRAPAGSLAAA